MDSLFCVEDCVCPKYGINLAENKLDKNSIKTISSFKTIATNIIYPKIII